ncbi:MAG: hypothetical protein WCB95_05550, partial [Aeromicrobium sp.]
MSPLPRRPLFAVVLVVLVGTSTACCSPQGEQASLVTAPNLTCGQDTGSDDAQDIVERVGGLVT